MEVIVLSHYEVHDGGQPLYNKYFFEIQVRPEPNVVYRVDRSYVDFVELDCRIKRRLPGTTTPILPLEAASWIEKGLNVSTSKGWNPFKQIDEKQKDFPLQIVSSKNSEVKVIPILPPGTLQSTEPEAILSKVEPLSTYLKKILKFHEIVASDELLLFLDEEAKDMRSNLKNLETLSIHDLLLMKVPNNKCTVRSSEDASFKMMKGQIIVWQFSTEGYDIGFSVSVNGKTKIALTRYNSHQKVASGSLEVTDDCSVTLCWDNSHARLRSKKLAWIAKVVSQEEYNTAKVQALEIQREKRKFETQRHSLQRAALAMATSMSGITHTASVVHEHAKEDIIRIDELENEIKRSKKEVESYQADLDKAQEELDELEKQKLVVEQSRDQMAESWRYTVSQLEQIKQEFDKFKEAKEEEIKLSKLGPEKEISTLKLEYDKEVKALKLECERLKIEADKSKSDYTNLKSTLYQLQDNVENETKAKMEYEAKCRANEEEIRRLQKEVADLQDSLRVNEKMLLDNKADYNDSIEAEKLAHANTKAIADKAINDAKGDVASVKGDLADANEREKLAALRIDSLERELMELKIAMETLKYENVKEIDKIKSESSKEIDRVKTESFNALAASNTTLESVMQSVQQMKLDKDNELLGEKEAHFRSNSKNNEIIADLQEQVNSLEDQLNRYYQAKEQFQQAISVPVKPPKRGSVSDSPNSSSTSVPPSPMSP